MLQCRARSSAKPTTHSMCVKCAKWIEWKYRFISAAHCNALHIHIPTLDVFFFNISLTAVRQCSTKLQHWKERNERRKFFNSQTTSSLSLALLCSLSNNIHSVLAATIIKFYYDSQWSLVAEDRRLHQGGNCSSSKKISVDCSHRVDGKLMLIRIEFIDFCTERLSRDSRMRNANRSHEEKKSILRLALLHTQSSKLRKKTTTKWMHREEGKGEREKKIEIFVMNIDTPAGMLSSVYLHFLCCWMDKTHRVKKSVFFSLSLLVLFDLVSIHPFPEFPWIEGARRTRSSNRMKKFGGNGSTCWRVRGNHNFDRIPFLRTRRETRFNLDKGRQSENSERFFFCMNGPQSWPAVLLLCRSLKSEVIRCCSTAS